MPREVMRYEGSATRQLTYYRLVDQRPVREEDSPSGIIERLDGTDAMGDERWVRVPWSEPVVWDLLNALADSNIEKRPVTFAVKTHDPTLWGVWDKGTTTHVHKADMEQIAKAVARSFTQNKTPARAIFDAATPEHIEEEDDGA